MTNINAYTTFALGAFHALEPGHGKSFMASFLITSNEKMKHLFKMLFSLLISHFTLLVVLGIVFRFFVNPLENEKIFHTLQKIGPALIVLFGVYLIVQYYRHKRHHEHHCSCEDEIKPNKKNPFYMGLVTGLVPCPTVFAPILLSSAEGDFSQIFLYIFLYIIGMVGTLFLILTSVVFFSSKFEKHLNNATQKIDAHLLSGTILIVLGTAYFFLHTHH